MYNEYSITSKTEQVKSIDNYKLKFGNRFQSYVELNHLSTCIYILQVAHFKNGFPLLFITQPLHIHYPDGWDFSALSVWVRLVRTLPIYQPTAIHSTQDSSKLQGEVGTCTLRVLGSGALTTCSKGSLLQLNFSSQQRPSVEFAEDLKKAEGPYYL